jgi:hypothetical protein
MSLQHVDPKYFSSSLVFYLTARFIDDSKDYVYALQMRYAQRKHGSLEELEEITALPVLSESEVISLLDFLLCGYRPWKLVCELQEWL